MNLSKKGQLLSAHEVLGSYHELAGAYRLQVVVHEFNKLMEFRKLRLVPAAQLNRRHLQQHTINQGVALKNC